MALTGHDQGVHDDGFGFTLFLLLLFDVPAFIVLFVGYLLYALTQLWRK